AAALVALAVAATARVVAAPPRVPRPEDAPHGIANQAAEASAPQKAAADTGPVAVPEPTPLALRHARGNDYLWVFDQVWGLALPALILFSGFSAELRTLAHRAGRNWLGTIVVYFVLLRVIIFVVELPMSYYAGFIRPHSYGLSNQAFSKWAGDEAK